MTNVVVKDNHLTYGGVRYFLGHAEEVLLGSIGEKRSPIGGQNYLEPKDLIVLGTAHSTTVKIDFTQSSKSDFKVDVKASVHGVPVNLSGDAQFSKLNSGELALIKLSVLADQVKKAANNSHLLHNLDAWGHNARICHQIFVIVDGEIATQFDGSGEIKLSGGKSGIEATAGYSSTAHREIKVVLPVGSTFAYLLAKIDWEGHGNNKRIKDVGDDQWGLS